MGSVGALLTICRGSLETDEEIGNIRRCGPRRIPRRPDPGPRPAPTHVTLAGGTEVDVAG